MENSSTPTLYELSRTLGLWLVIAWVLVFSGCSTAVTHAGYTYAEATSDEEPVKIYARVYCGTEFNLEIQKAGAGGNFLGFILLPDLIASAAADTLLLPLTWTHDELRVPTDSSAQAAKYARSRSL